MKFSSLAVGVITGAAVFGAVWYSVPTAIVGRAIVHDGDTIRIGVQSIRLAGIDAEELNEPIGYKAREALVAIIGSQVVRCDPSGKSYNRIVATCTIGNLDIGAEMVRQGYALDCAHYSGGRYRSLEPNGARQKLIQKPYC